MNWLAISSILVVAIIGIFTIPNAFAQVQIDPTQIYLQDGNNLVPYKLLQNSTSVVITTKEATYNFDKN